MDCQNYKPEIDFKYFIYLAFSKKMSWEMLGNLFEDLTQTFTQAKDLNKVLLEELRLCKSKLHEDVTGVQEIENEISEIIDENIESMKDQEKQDFEINDTSEQDEPEVKSIEYDFEYDFVGSNGIETRRLALDTTIENGSEGPESQHSFQNSTLPVHEEDEISDVKEVQSENIVFHVVKEQHISRVQNEGTQFQCKQCDKVFPSKRGLKRHLKIHEDQKKYPCNKCDKVFANKSNLKRHEHIHMDENPYRCNTCSKACSNISDLKRHERIHTGERPYKCKHCTKAFTNTSDFRRHERIHTGERPYKCNYCSEAFNTTSGLRQHERTHTAI